NADSGDSEPEPPRPADSEEDEEGSSPVKRRASTSDMDEEDKPHPASDSEPEETEKRHSPKSDAGSDSDEDKPKLKTLRDSDAEEEEEEKPHPASDSEPEETEKRHSPKSDAGSDSDEDKPKLKTLRDSDAEEEEEEEEEEEGGRKQKGKWKAVMNSDSEDEDERPKRETGSDEDEGPKRRALASDDDDDEDEKPGIGRSLFCQTVMKMRRKVELRFVINTCSMMSPDDDDDGACVSAEVKKSRLVSDDEDSDSDEGSGAPDKSLAAKLKELGSDSEDEEDTMKRDAGNKNEKALFGSDSDSGDDEEESVKKSRLVSDDEDSDSDEGSGAPDKSLAAKLKELGSDSEDEEDTMKRDAGNKNEKALFGSDSDSGDDEEEKMITDIFGESGDEEEEEFTGFNQEELEAERPQSQALGHKGLENDSDSDEDVDRGGKDMSFMSDFELMLARKKAQSGKRRRNRDGGTFISDADDVVSAMITKMTEAAEEDRTLNSQKKPALKKLMLLPTVVMHLKKQDLKDTFIDSGVMLAIKEWISPLPDKSLPALKIREELLKILQEVSLQLLKECLQIYLYYSLVLCVCADEWSRPIFGLSSNYKGMTREEREQRDLDQQIAPRRRLSSGGQTPRRDLEKVLTGEEKALRPGDPGFCARARVPMPSNKDYVVRPKWNVDVDSNRVSGRGMCVGGA
uniref:Protein IWS1 homolog n=1 Tax=Sinocyclocheilus rhinocerous TaxID=307959 RepID=A0A673KM62_9TELE